MSFTEEIPPKINESSAYEILINRVQIENPSIGFKYRGSDKKFISSKSIDLSKLVEFGVITIEEMETVEAVLRKSADALNPFNPDPIDFYPPEEIPEVIEEEPSE